MLAKVETISIIGLSAAPITAEVDVSSGGLPGIQIVGLPDATVREARERLRTSVKNSLLAWPTTRITINLAPADVRKEGSSFDLPMAVGLLAASGQLNPETLQDTVFLGELALDGRLRPVSGVLPAALSLKGQGQQLVVPTGNAKEAAVVEGVTVYGMSHLKEVVRFLKGGKEAMPVPAQGDYFRPAVPDQVDFSEVKGQAVAKRSIEIAVAGGHNLLLMGPPGAGKTMLVERILTVLPVISLKEAIQTTAIYSAAGLLAPDRGLMTSRPFRTPHHTISDAALVGGGTFPKPGEISLAHNGLLFLDELPEFNRAVLETLRQPLEQGEITVGRVHGTVTFPARMMVIAAMNPCPCGNKLLQESRVQDV